VRRYAWRWAVLAGLSGGLVIILISSSGLLPAAATERVESIARNLRLFDVRTVDVTGENFAVVERMAHLQAGWDMLTTHPLTGVGPGNFALAYEGRGTPQTQPFGMHPWYTARGHAHNYYLHMAAEAGLSGIVAYLLLLGLLIVQGYRTLRRAEGWFWQSVAVGGCGIIAAVATHNVFENLHVLNMGIQLGAIWGLLTALEKNAHAR
jgi:O-antigen ligase